MTEHHVGFEHYVYLFRGAMRPGEMLERMHRHVLEGCETCREAWDQLVEGQRQGFRDLLIGHEGPITFDPTPPPETPILQPSPYESAFSSAAKTVTRTASRLVQEKRRARSELAALLAIAPADREAAIMRSRKRFRSLALAHLLVEEARERVRRSWQEALELLALADLVTLWTPGAHASEWGKAHAARAAAHRANAYRVGGDLAESDRRFRELRRELALGSLADPLLYAEIASLEASLRWDQDRLDEAVALLDQAVMVFQETSIGEDLPRVLLKRGSLLADLDRNDEAMADMRRAQALLHPARQPFLYLFTIAGAVPILIDARRHGEARHALTRAKECPGAAEPWWALRLRHLEGRVELAEGDLDRAEQLLEEARLHFVEQEQPYEAAGVSLDLALVHLRKGGVEQLRRIVGEAEPIFQAIGIDRGRLAVLRLLHDATKADPSMLALVEELRRHWRKFRCPRRPPPRPS